MASAPLYAALDGAAELSDIPIELNLADLVPSLVPPDRFADASFESYLPSPVFRSQAAAVGRLRQFASELDGRSVGLLDRARTALTRISPSSPTGLYLDGGFGVGKTHLLAATYHATRLPRVYLSLAELAQTIVRMGLSHSVEEFRRYRLVCVDEFELDDVASTRMAAAFLRGLWATGSRSRVVVTSNTLPSDLGRGRFSAEDFAREIGEIAAGFEVVQIDGEDYRHRSSDVSADDPAELTSEELHRRFRSYAPSRGVKVLVSHDDLLAYLSTLHPIHYGQLARSVDALFVDDLGAIGDQDAALRFVHLIDKVYDRRVRLLISTNGALADVFAADYRHGSYARKYGRCLSRLHELLAESANAN
jgi:cell division protein ZapE